MQCLSIQQRTHKHHDVTVYAVTYLWTPRCDRLCSAHLCGDISNNTVAVCSDVHLRHNVVAVYAVTSITLEWRGFLSVLELSFWQKNVKPVTSDVSSDWQVIVYLWDCFSSRYAQVTIIAGKGQEKVLLKMRKEQCSSRMKESIGRYNEELLMHNISVFS